MAASYPASTKVFPIRIDGEIIYGSHMNDVQAEIVAIQQILGTTPQGTASTVKARIAALETGTAAASHAHQHSALSGLTNDDHPQYLLRSIGTTKGDVLAFNGAAWQRVAVGATRSMLIADPAQTAGVRWGFPSSADISDFATAVVTVTDANFEATVPPAVTPNATGTAGTSTKPARRDHRHALPSAAAVGLSNSTTNTEGNATTVARSNHTHALTGWLVDNDPNGGWTNYAPTLVNFNLGSGGGANMARWKRVGRVIVVRGYIEIGTGGGGGAGVMQAHLPVTPAWNLGEVSATAVGSTVYWDASTGDEHVGSCRVVWNNVDRIKFCHGNYNGTARPANQGLCNGNWPMPWAVGDHINWSITYEAAT